MANYKSGLFMGGMAQGISQGINWGTQLMDIRERKKARDEAKKQQEKITFQASELSKKLDQYGADGLYSDSELLDVKTIMLSGAAEVQERFKPIIENIEKGNTKEAQEQIKMIDEYVEYVFNLNLEPGQVEQTFNAFKNSGVVQSEQATRYLSAQENILKRKLEAREMQPEQGQMDVFPTYQAALDAYPYSTPKFNASAGGYTIEMPEQKEPTPLSQKDLLAIGLYEQGKVSFDGFLKYMGMQTTPATPEKKSALQEKIDTAIQLGASQEEIKNMVIGGSGNQDSTTEEMTAGEKRIIDTGNQVLFGESDIFAGIQKPGLVSSSLSQKLNRGVEPTPEETQEVLQSWNHIKGNYNSSVQNYVEAQLIRYGITSDKAITPEITEPESQNEPNIIERGVDWVKGKLGIGDQQPPEITEPPPETPNTKELEAPKNPALHTPEIDKQIEQDKANQSNPEKIKLVQEWLKDQGYWDYEITGKWTEVFENALRMFYKENPK